MSDDFSRLLRKCRKDCGLTQKQLLKRLNDQEHEHEIYSKSTISRWENGSRLPRQGIVETLEDVLFGEITGVLLRAAGYQMAPKPEQTAISEPEGKQESPPTEQTSQARLRDERTFRESDSIINEEGLLSFLVRLEFHTTYLGSTLKKVKEFRDLFRLEADKYVDDELTSLCDELVNALTKLIRFLEFSFKDTGDTETINAYDDNVYKFNPQNRYLREYEEYLKELQQLSWTSRDAYEAYRAAIRKILFL